MEYKEMPFHFLAFLDFLDSIQVIYSDFINDEEKSRLLNFKQISEEKKLSRYELEYMRDNKLLAIMNPNLLHILKHEIEERKIKPSVGGVICKDYYGELLPEMSVLDYSKLVKKIWNTNKKPRGNKKTNFFMITFPDGESKKLSITEAVFKLVSHYSFERIYKLNLQLRKHPFLLNHVPFADKNRYRELNDGRYVNVTGNFKDFYGLLRAVNLMLGNELKIEMYKPS